MVTQSKVVIIHDVLFEFGGAERVLLSLIKLFPQADIFTFYFNKKNPLLYNFFHHYHITSSLVQKLPWVYKLGKYFSLLKPIAWLYFWLLNTSGYKLIISSSHSFNAKLVRKSKNARHISYLYTPPRFLYKEFNEFQSFKSFPLNILLLPIFSLLRITDFYASTHPDTLVVSSKTVQKRVSEYYKRTSTIIAPPIDLPVSQKNGSPLYYLMHSRLVSQKGVELAVKTCTQYKLNLVVVGEGYLRKYLKKIAGPTIKFTGNVSDKQLPSLYKNAKALLYCSIDEDFGLAPLEAMWFGVPVIAYKSGGVEETVIHKKTGVLFSDYSPSGLYKSIKELDQFHISPVACHQHAKKFSFSKFRQQFTHLIQSSIIRNS